MAGSICDIYINNSSVYQGDNRQTFEITETGLKIAGTVVWTYSGTKTFKGFASSQGAVFPTAGLEVGKTLAISDVSALTGQSYDIIHIYSVESAPNRTISLENLYEFKYKLDEVKQDKLVSGTNIKTVNSQSILGSGNISTPNTNYYHVAGSWSGLSYILTGKGGASNIVITLPTGTSSTTVAVGNHNHNSLYLGINAKAADADKLDGQDGSYYLNYNNFANTPWSNQSEYVTLTRGYAIVYDDHDDVSGHRPPNAIYDGHNLDLFIYSTGLAVSDEDVVYKYSFPQKSGTFAMTKDIGLNVLDLRGYVDGSN